MHTRRSNAAQTYRRSSPAVQSMHSGDSRAVGWLCGQPTGRRAVTPRHATAMSEPSLDGGVTRLDTVQDLGAQSRAMTSMHGGGKHQGRPGPGATSTP